MPDEDARWGSRPYDDGSVRVRSSASPLRATTTTTTTSTTTVTRPPMPVTAANATTANDTTTDQSDDKATTTTTNTPTTIPTAPDGNPSQRPKTSPSAHPLAFKARWKLSAATAKRDSGLGTIASTTSNGSTVPPDVADQGGDAREPNLVLPHESATSLPALLGPPPHRAPAGHAGAASPRGRSAKRSALRISMDIPSGDLFGDESLEHISFSKRGSILLGGKRTSEKHRGLVRHGGSSPKRHSASLLMPPPSMEGGRQLSTDDMLLSQQVRSMYEHGNHSEVMAPTASWSPTPSAHGTAGPRGRRNRSPGVGGSPAAGEMVMLGVDEQTSEGSEAVGGPMTGSTLREDIGPIEDWEDLDGRDVDRYGFIVARNKSSRGSTSTSSRCPRTPEPQRPQRVSTLLQLASEAPRRNRGLVRKSSSSRVSRSVTPRARAKDASGASVRTSTSLNSDRSRSWRIPLIPFQYAASRLPGNRDKRFLMEAGDMLTLPPGLANIAEDGDDPRTAPELQEKEWQRAEKWRKMARVVTKGTDGRGMVFDFDVRDPKLISRTWKGIPDRWRATAWHAFLLNSAKKRKDSPSNEEIVARYHELLERDSADDVQIDMDVPRTINRHIMFRRRYRGGQRLLFRLLHSLSLYFPNTGYVQGMASLAATLLCYYDEDMAFVMLVRMWQLRGLDRLYQPGFDGLFEALGDFEKTWLGGRAVADRLRELNIDATAYGTRWYLTLFNYSIPFPAQLRVWDVFMLLGDDVHPSRSSSSSYSPTTTPHSSSSSSTSPHPNLDVLHATSTALIDGLTEILLGSDFENAMKVLTSWIPIRDEEMLMKVTKAEWKRRRRRR